MAGAPSAAGIADLKRTVAIVGGGLAGIATALRLADGPWRPILIETRKRLGGRATSFVDPRSGLTFDNCQHVVLGCCTNLLDLYDRLGVGEAIEWHRTIYWTDGKGHIDEVRADRLPAPLHLARAFGRMQILQRDDRKAVRRAMWRLIRMGSRGRVGWQRRTFAEFLDECHQTEGAVQRFWQPVVVSACNLSVDRVCAAHAMQVFQDGFLANRWSYTMGLPTVPLAELYDPSVEAIQACGGEVQLGTSAKALAFDGTRTTGVVTDNGFVEASAVVVATPFDRLEKLVSPVMRSSDGRLGRLDALDTSPILGVHLIFDCEVMTLPHVTLVDHGVQWLFNKGVDDAGHQHVHAVVSGADEWMAYSQQEIVDRVVSDMHAAIPTSVGLQPTYARAIKEKRATFAAVPGVDDLRPSTTSTPIGSGMAGGIKNLYLAGDWTDTGWPATMEGAVRSGYAAAAALTGAGGLVEDVPAAPLARVLGLGQ
jgi:zeta-carotene desaturase